MSQRIRIGLHQFEIQVVPMNEDCGSVDNVVRIIKINEGMTLNMKGETLTHEVFHAFNPTFGDDHVAHSLMHSFSQQIFAFYFENALINLDKLKELLDQHD